MRGAIHTNGIESIWSLFKRSIVSSYHQVSTMHLDRYVEEFEWRFNQRDNPEWSNNSCGPAVMVE